MRKAATFAVLIGIAVGGNTGWAHHSFAATYLESKTVTVQGKLVHFLYRNPHSFVQIEAKDAKGVMQQWAVEWGGAGQLSRDGITPDSLRPGDVVSVTGNPSRNPAEHRLRMQSIRRVPDGFKWRGIVE
jgi:hypothetical protein